MELNVNENKRFPRETCGMPENVMQGRISIFTRIRQSGM